MVDKYRDLGFMNLPFNSNFNLAKTALWRTKSILKSALNSIKLNAITFIFYDSWTEYYLPNQYVLSQYDLRSCRTYLDGWKLLFSFARTVRLSWRVLGFCARPQELGMDTWQLGNLATWQPLVRLFSLKSLCAVITWKREKVYSFSR